MPHKHDGLQDHRSGLVTVEEHIQTEEHITELDGLHRDVLALCVG